MSESASEPALVSQQAGETGQSVDTVETSESNGHAVRADDRESADDESESCEPVKTVKRGGRQKPHVYNCTTCSRSFGSRQDIVTHQYMHRENPTAFCAVCNKSFSSESAYRRHAASHNRKNGANQRARKSCSQCDMQFDTMRQLSVHHAAKHVDEKRFICGICGSQFAWPENLRAHQRTHELDPHECDICGRRFVDATSLRVHTRNAHSPSCETPVPRKQHVCKLCGRSFQFDFSLRAHMKGHAQSPVAASLRRLTKLSPSKPTDTTTKYVQMDSKGVIDLGLDVAQAGVSRGASEFIVEVYNSTSPQQSLDFSDVLDRSQTDHSVTDQFISTDQSTHKLDSVTDGHQTQLDTVPENTTSRLVWYVKPDELECEADCEQVQRDDSDHVEDECNEQPSAVAQLHNEHMQQPTATDDPATDYTDDPATAADYTDDIATVKADEAGADEAGEVAQATTDAVHMVTNADEQTSARCHDDENPAQQLSNAAVSEHADEEEIDWMEMEPPRRRAAPFIFRQTPSSSRRAARPREPFLFNCVMTDEKPYICMTCGQCFRWEISLSIHQRIHTDGTFPNKSRATRHRRSAKSSRGRGAKSKQSSPAKSSTVARSCIVRHQRTSSDEEDDEFTFHVHADGPLEVPGRYAAARRPQQAVLVGGGRGVVVRGRGQGLVIGVRGRGPVRGRGGRGGTIRLTSPSQSVSGRSDVQTKLSPTVGCNGVHSEQKPLSASRTSSMSAGSKAQLVSKLAAKVKARRMQLSASLVCRDCHQLISSLSSLSRHQRRVHLPSTTHSCHVCTAQFTSRLDLRRHCQRQHVLQSAAKCRQCQRAFTDSTRLQRHCQLHRAVAVCQ